MKELLHSCTPTLQPQISSVNSEDGIGGIDEKTYRSYLLLQDAMQNYVESLIAKVQRQNVEIRCGCTALFYISGTAGKMVVFRNETSETEVIRADYIVFATGRTSSDLIYRCFPNEIISDMPDLGIRLTLDMNRQRLFTQVGQDVKLKLQDETYLTRTFCVCTGGAATKVSLNGMEYYDGHFQRELTNDVNFGILSRSMHHSGRYAAVNYLKSMSKYLNQSISVKDFKDSYSILASGTPFEPLFAAIVRFLDRLFASGLIEQNKSEIPVLLPSVDHLCPQVNTNENFETSIPGVYLIGDATGISRGFVQALWSGKCAADSINDNLLSNFIPKNIIQNRR